MSSVKVGQIRANQGKYEQAMRLRSEIFEHIKAHAPEGITIPQVAINLELSKSTVEKHCTELRGQGYIKRRMQTGNKAAIQLPMTSGDYQWDTKHFDDLILKAEREEMERQQSGDPSRMDAFAVRENAVVKVNAYTTVYGARNISVPLRKSEPHLGSGSSQMLSGA
jgi:DNA-binding transcriptional MocR family regulator